jgi:tetratricopeptide (TPR) repeat protein
MRKVLLLLMAAAAAAGCSRRSDRAAAADRTSGAYKAAMADYVAGQLDAAIAGFEKVVRTDPANASARFQLATLLQDHRQDFLPALALYRAYLLQSPSSDKSALARERAARCEQQFVRALLLKHGGSNEVYRVENAELKEKLAALRRETENLKQTLAKTSDARAAAERENARLRRMVAAIGEGESTARPVLPSDRDLLEKEEETVDRVKLSADVQNLIAEEKSELEAPPLPVAEKKKPAPPAAEPPHEKRPANYVVGEGDTLYKIAIRFYGRRSAWRKIRDANKSVISVDGRVNAGATIVLP